jgi:hypothetical protein
MEDAVVISTVASVFGNLAIFAGYGCSTGKTKAHCPEAEE